MMALIGVVRHWAEYGAVNEDRSDDMKWETPQAVELRFGMEITMYVSNR